MLPQTRDHPILVPPSYVALIIPPRFVFAAFPVFLIAGLLPRARAELALYLVASAAAGVGLVSLFASWRFVA